MALQFSSRQRVAARSAQQREVREARKTAVQEQILVGLPTVVPGILWLVARVEGYAAEELVHGEGTKRRWQQCSVQHIMPARNTGH